MADLSTPLQWDVPQHQPARLSPLPSSDAKEKAAREAFCWPMPPYACYPPPSEQTDTLVCRLMVGDGADRQMQYGRLTFFVPEAGVAHLQVPPARTTAPLRFDQFTTLILTTPVDPLPTPRDDPHAALLEQRTVSAYKVTLAAGGRLRGETVGHAELDIGLFLFPPYGDTGSVQRMFIPRSAYSGFEVGPRLGEVLVEQQAATPQEVERAVEEQRQLRGQKLGDILVLKQVVTPDQLLEAIERQQRMPLVRIGEALVSLGLVREDQLRDALSQQALDRSVPLGELLVRMGVVAREDLQLALARKMGYPVVDVEVFPVETEALHRVSYAVASRLRVMPLLVREGRLILALEDPSRRAVLEEVEFTADMKIVPVLARERSIDLALHAAYERLGKAVKIKPGAEDLARPIAYVPVIATTTDLLVETLEKEGALERPLAEDDRAIEQSDNSLVRLLNNMIIEAHREGVSDIHIESYPGREKIRVRFRKDGLLRTYLELPPNYRNAIIARVKIMCDLDIAERRKPQDGKINFAKFSPQHKLELRVATIPTNNGLEDVVLRLLASARPVPIDMLGLEERSLEALKHAVERPYGLVLCVGPTGSGKTTTLHSALSHINVPERKIWTAEDPIEITQPGLRQVQVNPKIDWTFAKALRAFMRADPDVIMLGEIRDAETARMAIEASLTGHLVLSTLHTNSAPETVTRLLDMGMDPFNFGDSLLAVLGQRLLRQCCPHCRVTRPATHEEVEELLGDYMNAFGEDPPLSRNDVLGGWTRRHAVDGRLVMHRSHGCERCDHTGFFGRAGIHEMLVASRELRRMVQNGARAEALQRAAMVEGMRTLRQDGIDKVLAGTTTIEEVRSTSNA